MKTPAPYHGDTSGPKHPGASQSVSNQADKDNPPANSRWGNEETFHGVVDRKRFDFVLELSSLVRRGIARWCHGLFDGTEFLDAYVAHWAVSKIPDEVPNP